MDNKERNLEYTADQIWGLAVRVDRENGGYVKLPIYCEQFDAVKPAPNTVRGTPPIRETRPPTEDEKAAGRAVSAHF